jgi:hypothetical protein
MSRNGVSISAGIIVAIAAAYLLPLSWLGPLCAAVGIFTFVLVVLLAGSTKQEPRADPVERAVLLVLNVPSQPLAKVKQSWTLTTFLASAAFLVALGATILVRANG